LKSEVVYCTEEMWQGGMVSEETDRGEVDETNWEGELKNRAMLE